MAVKVGSARIDERGKAKGGKAGDNNGKEVSPQNWYKHSKGWVLIRPKSPELGKHIAWCMNERAPQSPCFSYGVKERKHIADSLQI